MIVPDVDIATATDAEIIAAYAEAGISEESARVYIPVLRNPDPEFFVD